MRFAAVCVAGALLCPIQASDALVHPNSRKRHLVKPTQAVSASPASQSESKTSKRVRLLNKIGFKQMSKDGAEVRKAESKAKTPKQIYEVKTVEGLEAHFSDEAKRFRDSTGEIDYDALLRGLSVKGDTQIIGSPSHPDYVHPAAKMVHERRRNKSKLGDRSDGAKVALVVEGGGMRGCVTAGMVGALDYLGLRDTVDVVYGSSAGSMIGAYFITGQLPWFGPEVYYDKLTTAGNEFIDTKRLLRSLGFGLADPRLFRDVLTRPNNGKPVLSLPFLLRTTMQETKPLDWEKFVERQKTQPLKVCASGLKSEEAVVMDMEKKSFKTLDELGQCMHASCLLPGIAGPIMNLKVNGNGESKPKFVVRNNFNDSDYEPLADALIYAPMPYDIAQKEGATHIIVLRSRPDGVDVTGKGGVFERLIFKRFFMRKNKLPGIFKRMSRQGHKELYAKNVIELNEAARSERDHLDTTAGPHILTVALAPGSEEVTRLETGREAIFEGVRRGFARAYDALVEDPAERGRGAIVARQYFPDEILDYDPTLISRVDDSAFGIYMHEQKISPGTWKGSKFPVGSP